MRKKKFENDLAGLRRAADEVQLFLESELETDVPERIAERLVLLNVYMATTVRIACEAERIANAGCEEALAVYREAVKLNEVSVQQSHNIRSMVGLIRDLMKKH